jgi:hypothetical protein
MELIGMWLVTFDLLNTSLIQTLRRWKALLIVREQLGLLVRAFHLSVGKPYWYCCVYYYYYSLKKIYTLLRIEKLSTPLHWTCWKKSPMLCLWTLTSCKLIDKLKKILISLSQKPLTLHEWKFWCKKTIICWKNCFFVLRVRWPIKELLPLKL